MLCTIDLLTVILSPKKGQRRTKGPEWLCCTSRPEGELCLSPHKLSRLSLWQLCQESSIGWGRRCGYGFPWPAGEVPRHQRL